MINIVRPFRDDPEHIDDPLVTRQSGWNSVRDLIVKFNAGYNLQSQKQPVAYDKDPANATRIPQGADIIDVTHIAESAVYAQQLAAQQRAEEQQQQEQQEPTPPAVE